MTYAVAQSFLNEALTLDGLRVPGIPELIDTIRANDTFYLVLPRIEGRTLLDWRNHAFARRVTANDAVKAEALFRGLLRILESLERKGLIHGDVAPDNIVVTSDQTPHLIDFGSTFHPGDPELSLAAGRTNYRPPSSAIERIGFGPWIDLYGLCVSFFVLFAGRPPQNQPEADGLCLTKLHEKGLLRHSSGSDRILAAIDEVIERGDSGEPISAIRLLAGLDHGAASGSPPSPRPPETAGWKSKMAPTGDMRRYQRCLLQSFDTPRFRSDDGEWLHRSDGEPLITSMQQKLALARAEALLNICFGREILVPAGQIADSLGFETVFREVYAAYKPRRNAIAFACQKLGMPEWRPFRVGIEDPNVTDYVSFTKSYNYTGADLVLLQINGLDAGETIQTKELITKAVELFSQAEFEELGTLIRTYTNREGMAELAREVYDYFDPLATAHAMPGVPRVLTSEYAELFRRRLEDERITGRGISDARESLDIVAQIESDLIQHSLQGLRGNWYVYRHKFGTNWPLARAYLDFRLFMNLSRLYQVDHPILVSQVFEYGRFFGHYARGADLVITGEGRADRSTAFDKAPVGIARRSRALGAPTLLLAGSVGDGYESLYDHGIDAIMPIGEEPATLESSLQNGAALLERAAERALRLYRLGLLHR